MKIQNLKGFRDFLPEDMAFQNWFHKNLKEVSESYGYQEYEGPTVEPLDLYAAKTGEELVKKQAFTFEDKSGKTVVLPQIGIAQLPQFFIICYFIFPLIDLAASVYGNRRSGFLKNS